MSDDLLDCLVEDIAAPIRNALVGGPFGSNLVSNDYVENGIPVIRGQNMGFGRWVDGEFAFVSEEKADSLSSNKARPGDLIFTQRGTLGQVAIVPSDSYDEYIISQSQMKLTPDDTKADVLYLYYCFSSPEQLRYIQNNSIQTGVPHTNLTILRSTPLVLPPLEEQRAIAQILGSLDDKIEANRRMNDSLEATARAIFKSWFVDFDPVHEKSRGEQPVGMDAATADLFPDSFEESALGLIPAGWEVEEIGTVIEAVGGATPSTKEPDYWEDGTVHFATPKDLSGLTSPVLLDTERKITEAGLEKISSGLLPIGTVLLSSRAPVGYLAIAEIPVAINQGFIAMICEQEISCLYALLWSQANMEEIESRASGTTFQEISKRNFRPIPVVVPDGAILSVFDDMVEPIYRGIVNNLEEIRTLAETRDALLPKLVSGEIRVGDVEDML